MNNPVPKGLRFPLQAHTSLDKAGGCAAHPFALRQEKPAKLIFLTFNLFILILYFYPL